MSNIYDGSITLASVYDGSAADSVTYELVSNREKIYKYFQNNTAPSFSATNFSIQCRKIQDQEEIILNTDEYFLTMSVVGDSICGDLISLFKAIKVMDDDNNPIPLFDMIVSGYNSSSSKTIIIYLTKVLNIEVIRDNLGDSYLMRYDHFISLLLSENFHLLVTAKQSGNLLDSNETQLEDSNYDNLLYGKIYSALVMPVEFGTSEDMAKFRITANGIEAAVTDRKLVFDGDGLTIKNGALTILQGSDVVFGYENNELFIKGSGEFSGTVNATGGNFYGNVITNGLIANNAEIGGFVVTNEGIFSQSGTDLNGLETNDESEPLLLRDKNGFDLLTSAPITNGATLQLYGNSGEIVANSITLGTGARIADFIELGQAKLYNPTIENGYKVLEAGSVVLDQAGRMQLGDIILDGPSSSIYGGVGTDHGFSITPELAIFDNVSVRGKISTAVFETNKVQTVGGAMYFKPSYKVESVAVGDNNENILTLDKSFDGKVGNYIYFINKAGSSMPGYGTIVSINNIAAEDIGIIEVALSNDIVLNDIFSIVDIGTMGDLIIGVNSNDGFMQNLYPRGITISEFGDEALEEDKYWDLVDFDQISLVDFNENNIMVKYTSSSAPKAFLGDLNSLNTILKIGIKGFGLYSENVYLTGSLTTQVSSDPTITYAGINTLSGARATVFKNDKSKIVFWGGSKGTSADKIQQAPFQVTQNGSLYATQGLFTGAIITRSEIRGADIYAARIHGSGKEHDENDPGLSFFDATDGIVFYKGEYDNNPQEIFSIGSTGLSVNKSNFIDIHSSTSSPPYYTVNAKFSNIRINTVETIDDTVAFIDTILIGGKKIEYIGNITDNKLSGSKTYLEVGGEDGVTTGLYYKFGDTQRSITIDNVEINLMHQQTNISNTLILGEKLNYSKVDDGYDLYVQ